jgi:hypothetical protein
LIQNFVLIGQWVFSQRTLENRPFPLKASIVYTTLPCANALACDYQNHQLASVSVTGGEE